MDYQNYAIKRLRELDGLRCAVGITEQALQVLTPEERMVVDRLYIHPQKRAVQELCELLVEISTALRDMILIKRAPDTALLYFADRSLAEELADLMGITRLFRFYEKIEEASLALDRNANINAVLTLLVAEVKNL
jgi:hypothetical protein